MSTGVEKKYDMLAVPGNRCVDVLARLRMRYQCRVGGRRSSTEMAVVDSCAPDAVAGADDALVPVEPVT
jgi:hypothetical protein